MSNPKADRRGRFITVEGIEGAGKSSQLGTIHDYLERRGIRAVMTREPGGTRLGEAVRGLLLDPDNRGMSGDAELLLMFAARAEHVARVIRPALEAGRWVVSDRFTDATYAYQGGGRGIDRQRIADLEHWVQRDLRPDLTLLLDVPVATGLDRARDRGRPDRFEREDPAFFDRVREAYLEQASREPGRYRIVDTSRPLAEVGERIGAALASLW